jgi:hypothetical protein
MPKGYETRPQNLEFLNDRAHSAASIADLRTKNLIQPGSPYWWSTDYVPDPREYLPFEEFYRRLIDIGEGYKLYPEPRVPMSVLDLTVEGMPLSFMVTARPYHEKETQGEAAYDTFGIDKIVPFDEALHYLPRSGSVDRLQSSRIPYHCLPHIRGMFIEAKGTHLFWSIIHGGRNVHSFPSKIQRELGKVGLTGIIANDFMYYSSFKTHTNAHRAAAEAKIINGKKHAKIDFDYEEVSRPEFCDRHNGEGNLAVKYPVRIVGLDYTLPVLVANRTHQKSSVRKPVALGIESGSGIDGKGNGLWTFRDRAVAQQIANILTVDLGVEVDALLARPRPGFPRYERLAPA